MVKIYCSLCNRKCKGDVLKVGDKHFHKECFTCKVCHKKMENTDFFCKDGFFYCLEDYKRFCASVCFNCHEKIIGEVVTALSHTFHKECFKCSLCLKCFSPGDKVSMRNFEFICYECCSQSPSGKVLGNSKVCDEPLVAESQTFANGHNNIIEPNTHYKDVQSSTLPIRRKNNMLTNDRPLSNNLAYPTNSLSNGRLREISTGDNNLDISARSSLIVTPKHFHLPPGNSRAWLYNSPIVGSKDHPLALSANNINRALSNSSQKINNGNIVNDGKVQRVSSYPYGDIEDGVLSAQINQENKHLAVNNTGMMSEKNRRKVQNPTVEALSAGTTPRIKKTHSAIQKSERNCTSSQSPTLNRVRLSEVIKRSTTDCSSLPKINDFQTKENFISVDPVSASRSPSAVCEPLVPPRYEDHTETSPSRNDDYFRSSNRHLGYSMEFINSTNRSFTLENTAPGYRRSLRNSNSELQFDNNGNYREEKKTRVTSNISDYKSKGGHNKSNSEQLTKEANLFNRTQKIPYEQLRVSTLKMIRHIDKSNLESYLTDEEFIKLFHLTKSGFYQLPEWKRNDLKKRVDLF